MATLEKMENLNVFKVVWDKGEDFVNRLKQLAQNFPACKIAIGGMPSSPTLTFQLGSSSPIAKKFYIRKMSERGFLTSSVFYLMLAHQPEHIDSFFEALSATLSELSKLIQTNQLDQMNANDVQSGFARLA